MHINNNDLRTFQNQEMNTDELIAFLEHLNTCDYCLEQLADAQSNPSNAAPAYMKEAIMKRATAPDTQMQKATINATHKMHLFYEGLQTVVGVVLALIMLFSLGQITWVTPQIPQSTAKSAEARRDTHKSIRNFSDEITDGIADGFSEGSKKMVDYINFISNTITNGGN